MESLADDVLAQLREKADPDTLGEMASRYGIHTKRALGVPMREMKALAKRLGTDHELATELWVTGWDEARIVASMVEDPAAVTPDQIDAWADEFANSAIVDTVGFNSLKGRNTPGTRSTSGQLGPKSSSNGLRSPCSGAWPPMTGIRPTICSAEDSSSWSAKLATADFWSTNRSA